jgi:HEAT repeat protein
VKRFITLCFLIGLCACGGIKGSLDSPDPDERRIAVLRLGDEGGPEAVKTLIKFLKDKDELVRDAAVVSLGKIGHKEFGIHLGPILLRDPSPIVRCTSAMVIGRIKARRCIPELLMALKEDQSPDVRRQAARALRNFPDGKDVMVALAEAIADPDPSVSYMAYQTLIALTGKRDIPRDSTRWLQWLQRD